MQSVSPTFQAASTASIRSPKLKFEASWTKEYGGGSNLFTIGASQIQGSDEIPGSGYVPNDFNFFTFEDDTAYVQSVQIDRFFDQPTSVARAALDITLDNTSGYFSLVGSSPIAGLVQVGKPLKVSIGFGTELVDMFNGVVSDYPTFNLLAKNVEIFGFDLVDIVANQFLTAAISLSNVTVDQVLVAIFDQIGIDSTRYTFDTGILVIPTVNLSVGDQIGTIIKDLMTAEGGFFWSDEKGKFRFLPRNVNPYPPTYKELTGDLVMDAKDLITTYIVNVCQVTGTGSIMSTVQDNDSIAIYGQQLLTINSPYIQSQADADDLAFLYVQSNSFLETFHILTIRGLPQFQLGDIVIWNNLTYVIIREKTKFDPSSGLTQELTLKRYTLGDLFTIEVSSIGGPAQIAG